MGRAGFRQKLVKDAAATAPAEDLAEYLKWIVKAPAAAATPGAHARIEGGVAVLIVGGAFLRLTQSFVGFTQLFEFFFGGFIAGILVGVIFDGELPVSLFDFLCEWRFVEGRGLRSSRASP